MSVLIPKKKLAVFTAPKVACSSIKTALFKVENGFEFEPFFANGVYCHIHSVAYPTRPFEFYTRYNLDDYMRFAIVRDPIRRFLSCYSNRVGYYRELSDKHLPAEAIRDGLKPDPTLHEFIDNLSEYRRYSNSISYHSAPMVDYLGHDKSFYQRVFRFSEIGEFQDALSDYVGFSVVFPRIQTGGEKIAESVLSEAELKSLKSFYAKDYEVFGELFD